MGRMSPILSEREAEVAALICCGLSNREISSKLFVTEKTIKYHSVSIYRKTKASRDRLLISRYWRRTIGAENLAQIDKYIEKELHKEFEKKKAEELAKLKARMLSKALPTGRANG